MGRIVRIKLFLRRFSRRHPWIIFSVRSFMIFSATFGGAYGFIAGSRSQHSGYDPGLFAIGAQAMRAGHDVKVLNLSSFPWSRVCEIVRALDADVYAMSCWTATRGRGRGTTR